MANVELVIKMSKESYEQIIEEGDLDYLQVITAIENGIVLPKRHGKIVDANRVLENGDNWEVETALMQTEAIIEADTESEDKI